MKTLWCWRCRAEIPMLDEEEWRRVEPLLGDMIGRVKAYRRDHEASLPEAVEKATLPARLEYERITGFHERNPNAIWHHRVALYGPGCRHCGKPLRTPLAKHCAACGRDRVSP